ncbi:PREDICTED: protein lifeguard 4-like [Branchiostoma belcheri]|uniref:Protein lifeguard 4-like n=1 Tax=Branchiostoma belcheri TaxID=7741 RepID=A0A6P4YN38_BRABE|nr:PREDICTED: protein lifeguard 4-like [Branchiostoma belcheri]KAI8511148.1 Transmembrane BAX inhibitor motif-containing protein 4 [Branchiostoma belcheri]
MATSVPLPTFVANPEPSGKGQSSIMDDFMYGTNVASSHVYIRMAFLRKVYGILSMQLALTTLMGALFIYTPAIKTFVQGSPTLLMVALFLSLGILVALHVKRTEYPTNMYLLAAFTFVEAYSVGTLVTFYDQAIVLQAFALTLSVCVGLTLYTLQSKKDYSSWGAGLFSALWILVIAGFLHLFFPRNDFMEMGLAVGGALLFCLFIVFDTSMLMHKLSPEEYILASINLYLDMINLFLHILRILSEANKK